MSILIKTGERRCQGHKLLFDDINRAQFFFLWAGYSVAKCAAESMRAYVD